MTGTAGRTRSWAVLVPIVGLVTAIALLLWWVDVGQTLEVLSTADWRWLGVALAILCGTVFLAVVKVWVLFRIGGLGLGGRRVLGAILASATLNAFIPGRGGDLVRAVFLIDDREDLPAAAGLVLTERLIDVASLGLLSATAAALAHRWPYVGVGAVIVIAAVALFLVLSLGSRSPVFRDKAVRVSEAVKRLARRPAPMMLVVLASLGSWACNVGVMAACLAAVRVAASGVEVAGAAPLAILTGVLPISVSGIGTRDLALASLLSGYEKEAVVAGAILYTVIQAVVLPAVGALLLGNETLASYRRLASSSPSSRLEIS